MSDSRRPESTITLLWNPQKSHKYLGSHNCKQFFVSLPLIVCFVWQVMARRVEPDGRMRFLVHWFPEDMWVHTGTVISTSCAHYTGNVLVSPLVFFFFLVCQTSGFQSQKPRIVALYQSQVFLLLPWHRSKLPCLCPGGTSSVGNHRSSHDDRTLISRVQVAEKLRWEDKCMKQEMGTDFFMCGIPLCFQWKIAWVLILSTQLFWLVKQVSLFLQ